MLAYEYSTYSDKGQEKMARWLSALLYAQLALCRPNIVFILVDDQDLHMESVEHMPYLKVANQIPHVREERV